MIEYNVNEMQTYGIYTYLNMYLSLIKVVIIQITVHKIQISKILTKILNTIYDITCNAMRTNISFRYIHLICSLLDLELSD
jgi:hypothetical protein